MLADFFSRLVNQEEVCLSQGPCCQVDGKRVSPCLVHIDGLPLVFICLGCRHREEVDLLFGKRGPLAHLCAFFNILEDVELHDGVRRQELFPVLTRSDAQHLFELDQRNDVFDIKVEKRVCLFTVTNSFDDPEPKEVCLIKPDQERVDVWSGLALELIDHVLLEVVLLLLLGLHEGLFSLGVIPVALPLVSYLFVGRLERI